MGSSTPTRNNELNVMERSLEEVGLDVDNSEVEGGAKEEVVDEVVHV